MEIKSKDNKNVKLWSSLRNKKYRLKEDLFLLEGYNLVNEAKQSGYLEYTIGLENTDYIVSRDIIDKITETSSSQDIIGIAKISNILANNKVTSKVLLLDNIQDPGNLGTILRSSVAFNFDTIVLDNCCDIFNPKVIRSSQGAIFKLNFIFDNILTFIENNNSHKYYKTTLDGTDISTIKFVDNIGIIMGNEGNGIRKDIMNKVQDSLTIKMNNTESLNVGIATSIIMYEINKVN